MTRAGIEGIATYVPPGRLPIAEVRRHWPGVGAPGGVRSVSVAGYDEDVVTMGTEAADAVLAASGLGAEDVDLILMATSSSPYAEHSAAAEVARALGLRRAAGFADVSGSTTSGVTALAAAIDAVKVGRVDRALVVSAERRRGRAGTAVEALGAGAAAVLVTAQGPLEALSVASWRHGVPTRWRPDGAATLHHYDDSRYELLGQILPAVSAVLGELGSDDGALTAIGPLDVRSRSTLLRALHLDGDGGGSEVAETGDLGGAGPLFALAGQLTSGATGLIRCIGIEPGSGAIGVALRTGATVPVTSRRPATTSVDYVEFLQRGGDLGTVAPPPPIVPHGATPGAARDDADGSLTGGRCQQCRSLHVPPRRVCADCGGTRFIMERAPRSGVVVTYNVQHVVAVHPEPAPVAVGVIRLTGEGGDRGGQVSAMFCDSDLGALAVGTPIDLVYRRLGLDDGLVKYGWKARVHVDSEADLDRASGHDATGRIKS